MSDPTDIAAVDEMTKYFDRNLRFVVAKKQDILNIINQTFRKTKEIETLANEISQGLNSFIFEDFVEDDNLDVPIKKLLNSIFEDSLQVHASDIHIEPDEDLIRIRQRVDGILQEQVVKGKQIISALTLRLKLIAKLDITEKRLPQDGRFTLRLKEKKIDFRISTMPVKGGESVVLRVLDQSHHLLSISQLGMPEYFQKIFYKNLNKPHGMILVTGPTGSGKTTTLYSGLSYLNSPEKKIITVEDPIEYNFSRINQVQVNPNIGLTFSKVLRSAMRQDPDILMVGEIRDEETAAMALRAAMTGHIVLSTLHTNDALASPGRLVEMGIDPFLVSNALRMVIAQRLIRRICPNCAAPYQPTEQEMHFIKSFSYDNKNDARFMKGQGCMSCRKTGYKGRIGVYEVFEMTPELREAFSLKQLITFNEIALNNKDYKPLLYWAFEHAFNGKTTLEEVMKVFGEVD